LHRRYPESHADKNHGKKVTAGEDCGVFKNIAGEVFEVKREHVEVKASHSVQNAGGHQVYFQHWLGPDLPKAGLFFFFLSFAIYLVLKDKMFGISFCSTVGSRNEVEYLPCLVELFLSDQERGCFWHKVNKNTG
jgi:hypothetical protein